MSQSPEEKAKRAANLKRRAKYQLTGFEKSLTKQSDKDKCNVNNIVAKHKATGLVDHLRSSDPIHGNFIGAPEYHEAQTKLAHAQQHFDQLPSNLRKRFDNDPREFIAFVHDEKNNDELVKMGIRKRVPVQSPEAKIIAEKNPPPAAPPSVEE